ncbi:MAG TPA: pyridoxal phosphate-dependent aminotransferase [Candidatus Paceibacterota bacterium]|nr:pyridoxal phosphate-dependent aminotransferase [Verrucomicrobiota bacterium]HOX01588.1 pyridoxal phosphate-dependent aminotransferase [Verrucomicrobiota bacterium]HRZ44326.1 pyridoxal phosphate-dependent aminotransferase [Candidatus Paceibacterota bacterium]HRZ92322.1 pyridoxal phosphate-dependent aminotransferase [Candidatus Paceibacterota bacterium]
MNYRISQRAASLSPSLTLAIDALAKKMRADGMDVVGFGAGEPDFDTPQHIKEAAAKALADGFTKYTPSSGIPELRQAIADKFQRDNQLAYQPNQIIVSCGGKHSCYNVILATCQPGDEVIIPAPYWLSYPEMVKLAGATPVILPTTDQTEFRVAPGQLRAAITPRTRLFILNSPSNPTGSLYSPDEIRALGDICVEQGILIMSDEIYEKLVYDGARHASVASFSPAHYDHTIVVHGLAKAYSMTGWRLGYLAAPAPIAQAIDAIQSHSTSNPTSFAQKGGVAALNGPQDHLATWLAEYTRRRTYAHQRINAIPGLSCVNAKGAFYLFPNIARTGLKSREFCTRLLEQEKVAAVPGIAFGADDYFRISYATSMAQIEKGIDRLERFVRTLTR